jgi:serine/threonine protein kinase
MTDITDLLIPISPRTFFDISPDDISKSGPTRVFNAWYDILPPPDENGQVDATAACIPTPVTVKHIKLSDCPDPNELVRLCRDFLREVFITTSCQSSVISCVLGWSVANEHAHRELFLALDGQLESLETRLHKDPPLTYPQQCTIIYGIARGMDHLHSLPVIHPRLAASNVYLDQKSHPQLVDLGIATLAVSGDSTDFSSDVLPYGLLSYEILTGQQFKGDLNGLSPFWQSFIASTTNDTPTNRPTFRDIMELFETSDTLDPETSRVCRASKKIFDEQDQAIIREKLCHGGSWLAKLYAEDSVTPTSLISLCHAADLGDFSAQIACGLAFLTGKSVRSSLFHGFSLLRPNREQSYVNFLLSLFEDGETDSLAQGCLAELGGNLGEAARIYRALARAGNREAALRFGALLLQSGDDAKEAQGVKLLARFAGDGSYEANYTLGEFYFHCKQETDPTATEKALAYFRAIAPIAGKGLEVSNFYPYMAVGWLLAKLNKWDECKQYCDFVERVVVGESGAKLPPQLDQWKTTLTDAAPKLPPAVPRPTPGGRGARGRGGPARGGGRGAGRGAMS